MAPHSSTLAWKIPWMEEPGGLQSMGSLRVGHDWATSLSLFIFMHWRRKWQPTPVFLPGESQGWGSLVGCVYGVAQSRTWLKWLSSSSIHSFVTLSPIGYTSFLIVFWNFFVFIFQKSSYNVYWHAFHWVYPVWGCLSLLNLYFFLLLSLRSFQPLFLQIFFQHFTIFLLLDSEDTIVKTFLMSHRSLRLCSLFKTFLFFISAF